VTEEKNDSVSLLGTVIGFTNHYQGRFSQEAVVEREEIKSLFQ
jgi:hypothetical protein